MDGAGHTEIGLRDRDSVTFVTEACGCDEEQAVDLLTRAKYDAKRAIKLHFLRSKYRTSPQASRRITPSTPRSEASDLAFGQYDDGDETIESDGIAAPETSYSDHPRTPPGSVHAHQNNEVPLLAPLPNRTVSKETIQDHGAAEDVPAVPGWDFVLPVIPPSTSGLAPDPADECETFSIRELVAWMQYGIGLRAVQQYLSRFDDDTIKTHINHDVEGFPTMFYVVETNNEDMLRLWVSYGGDISVIHQPSSVPLLAFAIMHSENIQSDTTLMTATLLSLGASPELIPSAFYSPYLQDLPDQGPSNDNLKELTEEQEIWCKDVARSKLARTCSLSQRYYLERATKTKKPSRRQYQVAQRTKSEPLLGIANFLIGQTTAAKALLDTLLAHITEPGKKPLVLVFAGPSGHGKTELARRLGHLLSLELEVVDCTIFSHEMELFGPRHPYMGAEKGTPLNNFLAKHHEERCIVFLDEFEKTSPDIHKALLLPFENGDYQDRRNLDKVRCSKTIWILATNAHDPIIQDFSTTNSRVLFSGSDEDESKRLLKQLSHMLRDDFRSHHGAPITGRISEFLPFLTFSIGEQAVIAHKALLELGRKVRQPVNLSGGPDERLLGNVRLRIRRDASVCRALAESEYHADLGARSLIAASEKIKRLLVEEYLKVDDEISESDGMSEFILDVNGGEVVVNMVTPRVRLGS